MPSVTVKSYAELIHTPLYGQIRILHEQKHPRQAPGVFKVQYYRSVLDAIRRYFRHGNDPARLPASAAAIPGCGNTDHRRNNNWRAIQAFLNSGQSGRGVTLQANTTYESAIGNVTLRATPSFTITEGNTNNVHYLLYDCTEQLPQEETWREIVRTTVELFHHVLAQNGVQTPLNRIEYVHLETDSVLRWNGNPRQRTLQRANGTAAAINALWETI